MIHFGGFSAWMWRLLWLLNSSRTSSVSPATCQASPATCQASPATCQASPATCQASPATNQLAFPRVQRSTETAPLSAFIDSPMTMVRLLIGPGPQHISGARKPVADEGVLAYTSRHDSSATICSRQLVFNIKHV